MPSVDTLIAEVLQRPDYLHLTRRGRGVKASDLIAVGWRLFNRKWRFASEGNLKPRSPIPDHRLDEARELVEALAPELMEAAHLAARVNRRVLELAAAQGSAVTLSELSEPVLGRIGALMHSGEQLTPDLLDRWVEKSADDVLALRTKPRMLTATEFLTRYAVVVDRLWEELGAAALAQQPPSHVFLGHDARPPVVPRPGQTEDWLAGSDRSFHGRYALHWRGVSEKDDPGAPAPDHQTTPRVARPADSDLGELEIRRGCRPLGLDLTEHQMLIRAACHGVGAQRGAHRGAWRRFRASCRSTIEAAELDSAVADLVDGWLGDPTAERLQMLFGDLATHHDVMQTGMTRKVWMEVLRREREFEAPMCSCAIARSLRLGLSPGIPEAFREFGVRSVEVDDSVHLVGSIADRADDPFADPVERATDRRHQETFALVAQDMKVARDVFGQAPGWDALYRGLIADEVAAGGDERDFLSVVELEAYVMRQRRRLDNEASP
ncbi:MAG: hypothetical protein IPM08_01385 [Actinomycetales bacterium]|nr:hypothetical protein [Actinomycetales bacterium]